MTLELATAHATEVASHPTARGTGLDLALAVREPELHQGQQRGLAREHPRPLAPFDNASEAAPTAHCGQAVQVYDFDVTSMT